MLRCGDACLRIRDPHRWPCRFLLLVVAYVCFLLSGALLFSALELPHEEQLRDQLRSDRLRFLRDHQCVSPQQLQRLLTRALDASNYGVSVLQNTTTNRNWDFTSALFFTSTVLSTTGYGHTVPLSDEGKAFCIIYSVVGIPFTLLFLSAVVQRVMEYSTRRPLRFLHRRWATSKPLLEALHAALLAFLVASCFFLIPAIIFSILEEDWNFLESFYFCFISLSTIGLGDYVPGEGYHQRFRDLYKLGITFYLMLGLIAMLVVLETFCELQQMRKLRKLFYLRKQKTEDELHIVDHDHLSFSSVSEHGASFREDKSDLSPDEMISASPTAACDGPMDR